MNSSKVVTTLVVALLFFSNPAFPQSGRGEMHGYVIFERVTADDYKEDKRAKVELRGITGRPLYKAETDERGGYHIKLVDAGEYVLRVTSPGYRAYQVELYIHSDFICNLGTSLKKETRR